MQQSVQALTEKIYHEGITKAEEDGAKIISEAKEKSREIVAKAEARASEILASADKKAAELRMRIDAELRLSARQALGELKQRITDLLIGEITTQPINKAFEDTEFIKRLIEKLVDFWLANFTHEEHLRILLPEDDYNEYRDFLKSRSQELLSQGIVIEFKGKMKRGFLIENDNRKFKVSFTAEDFENYFRTYARPRTYKLLFGEEQ
jgi:V/A-type H+-transporting ATPase subunit E